MSDEPEEEPEAEPEELPPYVIENARSGRAKCKTCQRKIDADALRIGVLVEGRFGQGYMWHHLNCGAKRMMDQVEEAYAQEAWLNAKVPPDPEDLPTLEKLRTLAEKAEVEREKKEKAKKTIPYAEIAPSNRSKCKQSGEPIEKGAVRIILGMEAHFGNQTRVSPYAVLPRYLEQALMEPDMGTEEEGLAEALRENSRDIDPELLEQAIAEAGL
ncbi:Poly(ADP-ribose) polymerase and DNA-Ligase Zn-finger region [Planctomycetes bacterium Poly30]|uniref:Poly(ADP-ribose) polymerase and DNA-Ligase Zn-finger region n=1 Tax=Saltatorellus ferox TaxID=2528018 RepID=A0A518EW71_9BACT|nr:Poly(ADP-ribose) polymerase and DNA-Ligase Zn-finger region [Planctomycetes bacterium Poly30]